MVSNLGHISGGHFNPAITLGFVSTRRITLQLALSPFCLSAARHVSAAFILPLPVAPTLVELEASPAPNTTAAPRRALILEGIMTFFLVSAVSATAVDTRGTFKAIAGLAMGRRDHDRRVRGRPCHQGRAGGERRDGFPARAFGPQIASNSWTGWWIYWIGTSIGALVAALVFQFPLSGCRPPLKPVVVGRPEGVFRRRPAASGRRLLPLVRCEPRRDTDLGPSALEELGERTAGGVSLLDRRPLQRRVVDAVRTAQPC